MKLKDCHNTKHFRELARRKLPAPIFHYIDGAADDETTYRRNTAAFEECDLVPNVLTDVSQIDMSVEVLGRKIDMPIFLSPTALQRLFHHQGELAVGKAAEQFGTYFGISSLATVSIERIASAVDAPKIFQLYVHKDDGLTRHLIERCKHFRFDALALTVDTTVGGNRERDLETGFTSPPQLTLSSLLSFASRPAWVWNYLTREKFSLAELSEYVDEGSDIALSIAEYFTTMLDQSLSWEKAEAIRKHWDGEFCLKGIMSVSDAKRAVDIGATAIMVSNHGGRQLDGGRAPFDQLAEICDAVGNRIDVICDGGIRRGSHVLKALSVGAKACSGGRFYLYALAAAGQAGVERALLKMREEIQRDMKLMGVTAIPQLNRDHLRYRR